MKKSVSTTGLFQKFHGNFLFKMFIGGLMISFGLGIGLAVINFTAKTDWKEGDSLGSTDLNRIEQGMKDLIEENDNLKTEVNSLNLNKPDYDSGWFRMYSQAGANSYKEVAHNLGSYPTRVKVLVKAIDGRNKDFIFEGMGSSQQNDDYEWITYGGVVFAYDKTRVRMWTPDRNNNHGYGRIISIGDGWGGEVNAQESGSADVKVLVWE